jgi:REP element-mobilizing transposase RayT
MHLIAQCPDMIRFVNSFKSYTAKMIIAELKTDSRRHIIDLLEKFNKKVEKQNFQVWQEGNWPELIESGKFFETKLEYIHNNPVEKGYVEAPEDWAYSSAKNYVHDDHSLIEIVIED